MTYSDRRKEIEKLLELAKQMEAIVFDNDSFWDDPGFEKLEQDYHAQLRCVLSLSP